MPAGQPAAEASSHGTSDAHSAELKTNATGISRSLSEVFAYLTHGTASLECLVPVNYATTNVFKQLEDKQKAARNTRSCDYLHLMLLLPFSLSNLFREEVEEHNSTRTHRGAAVVDPSEELIGVTNVFLRWYKLFSQITLRKTAADINLLRTLSHRYIPVINIIHIIVIVSIIRIMTFITLIHFISIC